MARYANELRKFGHTEEQLRDEQFAMEVAHRFRTESVKAIVRSGAVPKKLVHALPGLLAEGVDSVLPAPLKYVEEDDEDGDASCDDDEPDEFAQDDDNTTSVVAQSCEPTLVLHYGSILVTFTGPDSPAKISYETAYADDDDDDDDEEDDYDEEEQLTDEENEMCEICVKGKLKKVVSVAQMREWAVDEIVGWPAIALHDLAKNCDKEALAVKLNGDAADISALNSDGAKRFFWQVMKTRAAYWTIIKTQHGIQRAQAIFNAANVDESVYDYYRTLSGERAAPSKPRKLRRGWSVPAGYKTAPTASKKAATGSKKTPAGPKKEPTYSKKAPPVMWSISAPSSNRK
jgi:hypothetical protein